MAAEQARPESTLFAVVCKWKDLAGMEVRAEGHEAIMVEAADANEAQGIASAARPDLWARDGLLRETAVHPATYAEARP